SLPEHMVPSAFVGLSRLPQTPSGKIDRKTLPDVEGVTVKTDYVAPRSEREAVMCQIMRNVISHDRLHLDRVGIDDQFFDIGGHSIFAAQFAMRLEKALGTHVPVRLVFECPTVRQMVGRLDESFGERLPPVVAVDRTAPVPASFEQERMWLANSLYAGQPVYNEGLPLKITGPVDTEALLIAVQGILDRYETLRTRLVSEDGRLYQRIDPVGALKVVFEDWSGGALPVEQVEQAAQERCASLIAAPYDLGEDHPCRALILKLSDECHVWCLATHHSVGDNWSLGHVMPSDIFELYTAAVEARAPELPKIALHYADYAAWQRSDAMSEILTTELAWWKTKLEGAPEVIDLPSDRPRPAKRDHQGSRIATAGFDKVEWRAIEDYAVRHNGTPFMVFVAALSGLLSRVTLSTDIVLGTPHVMKPDAALWDEFGYFGNTLALRTEVDGQASFDHLFELARTTVNEAFDHQYVPFEQVAAALSAKPSNATPVCQVLLVMHAYLDEGAFDRPDMAFGLLGNTHPQVSKYDLALNINPGATGVDMSVEYATDLFDETTIQRLGEMLQRFLTAALATPQTSVTALPLVDEAERELLLHDFNNTAADYPLEKTVIDLFAEQVLTRPDACAVIDGNRELSYGELDAASNRLARYLMTQGVGPERVVGVCLERSAQLIIALLAIWKAGGAYLPLDPDYPPERLAFMLEDA
ncbi:condensation domain-containing protein, partial [Roseibium sp. RKSG952]|uniref:condensation domain-containing protein n=1 Tax=Roseibium sp. RKSG952 TaxID=2529384 RepID=UPI0012BC62F0